MFSNRIENWKNQFDPQTQNRLNYRPESLLIIESLILDKISSKLELTKKENYDFLFNSILYIGEVFIRNDKFRKLKWKKETSKIEELFLDCSLYSNSWVDIYKKIPRAIHLKSGNVLIDYFHKNIKYFEENHAKLLKPKKNIIPFGNMSYQHYILLYDINITLKTIEAKLLSLVEKNPRFKEIEWESEQCFRLILQDNYSFTLELNSTESVIQESIEFADVYKGRKDKQKIASSKSRIEFSGEEDLNGDYFNEHLFILQRIVTLPVFIMDVDSGMFFDEI